MTPTEKAAKGRTTAMVRGRMGMRICVAIPDTILEEQVSPREKTAKLGQIARYCSLFGVESIRVFHDPRGRGESSFIKKVLEYLETPQYLRRRLFPLSDDLRFAGLLPPLRIPSHKPKVSLAKLQRGEHRDGVVLADGLSADAGLDRPISLSRKEVPGKRVTLRVTSASSAGVEGVVVERKDVDAYWGYSVEVSGTGALLADPAYSLKVATSRYGEPVTRAARALRIELEGCESLMLLFGSPARGLFDIIGKDLPTRVNYVVNLFPEQHVVTARSEEAILTTLYLVRLLTSPELPPFV